MKKLLSLLMIFALCVSFVACATDNSKAVEDYVAKNKSTLIRSMEQGFAGSGFSCDTDVEVEGAGMIFTIKINQLDDVSSTQKDLMQSSYDAMSSTFEASLKQMQTEIPELEFFEVKVCEKDGDLLATITAGDK